jgi:hypothetical protein
MGMNLVKRFFLTIVLLLSFPPSGFTERVLEFNNDAKVCVEEVNQLGYLNFFTWSAKQILDALAQNEFLKESEWKTVEMNPALAFNIKKAADLALEISEGMCPFVEGSTSNGTYGADDEVDSIRHFVMSSYLAWKVGPQPARLFMAAHEDSHFEKDNMMDYYNNNLGFQFGENLRKSYQAGSLLENNQDKFLADLKQEIRRKHNLPRGDAQDFVVLTSGPSSCARRKYPNF